MLVAIRERDSLCRPRHSICLQILIKPVAYVSTSFIVPPSPFPISHLPPCLTVPLSISSSRCPPPHCHSLPVPIAPPHLPLSVAPFQIPPPCLPLPTAIHPLPSLSFLSTLPPPDPTFHYPPCFQPLPAPQHPFPNCPSPHRQLESLIDSNQVCPTYQ